jgi:PhnB protein
VTQEFYDLSDEQTNQSNHMTTANTATTKLIQPYLFFNGRCEEAIEYYKKAIGGELEMLMRYKESPDPVPPGMIPDGWGDKVMHASLRVGQMILMASDGCGGDKPGFDGFSLSLIMPNEAEAERAFNALAEGGQVRMPLTKTFWSPCFGMLQDRFGVGWMVTVPAEQA